ncbi:MAG: hypothetical protein NVS3B20_26740 [Polyangiales bacterium]
MKRLTVVYDRECPICVRCRDWLIVQASYVELEFIASGSATAKWRYGSVPWVGEELVVVSDEGDVWAGASAFLVALWALRDFREWSYRLSGPALAPSPSDFFTVCRKTENGSQR